MDDHDTPKTVSQVLFGDRDQTPPSTWSSKPSENSKPKPSAKIRGLIGRLGLRYHPANQADLASHQAMLTLLAEDVAGIPPEYLERAIDRHVANSPYMPKAADLIRLAKEAMTPAKVNLPQTGLSYAHDLAASYNAQRTRDDVEWIVGADGGLQMVHKLSAQADVTREMQRRAESDRRDWMHRQNFPVTALREEA